MKKIPITKYLVINAPEESAKLCNDYGLDPKTIQQLYGCMNDLLKQGGDEALREFALIHPDRELILMNADVSNEQKQNFSNASGDFSCEKTSGADGSETANADFKFDLQKNLPFIFVSAGFLTGLIILAKTL
jgi:hypothetical protein